MCNIDAWWCRTFHHATYHRQFGISAWHVVGPFVHRFRSSKRSVGIQIYFTVDIFIDVSAHAIVLCIEIGKNKIVLIFSHCRTIRACSATFASQITSGVAIPFTETRAAYNKESKNSLYVMLRRYRGLIHQGYGVKDKTVSYEPFKLVHEMSNGSSILLIICVIPVTSVYTGESALFDWYDGHGNVFNELNSFIRFFQFPMKCCCTAARNFRRVTQLQAFWHTSMVHRSPRLATYRKT